MRWYFRAAVAFLVVTTLFRGLDCKAAKVSDIADGDAPTKEKKEAAVKEANPKKASTDEASLDEGREQSEHVATGKQDETNNSDPSSEEKERAQDPRGGSRRRKNRNRRRNYRRHNGYRAYKRKFHNQKDYYYLKRILEPDSGMVQDVATLDDIITLDSADDDLPRRKKRDAKSQANDDSCSDSDDD